MFPLGTALLPGQPLPLQVFEPRYLAMLRDVVGGDGRFGAVLIERGSEVGGGDRRFAVGCAASIEQLRMLPDGRLVLLARGRERVARPGGGGPGTGRRTGPDRPVRVQVQTCLDVLAGRGPAGGWLLVVHDFLPPTKAAAASASMVAPAYPAFLKMSGRSEVVTTGSGGRP